jgi:hypothetical protein
LLLVQVPGSEEVEYHVPKITYNFATDCIMLSPLSPDLIPRDLHFHRPRKEDATDMRGKLEKHIPSPRNEKCGLYLGQLS